MLAKNITEIKLFIKELDGKNRSNRKTYILVRNCREGSLFCDVHLITITQNKEHLFLSYCQSQVLRLKVAMRGLLKVLPPEANLYFRTVMYQKTHIGLSMRRIKQFTDLQLGLYSPIHILNSFEALSFLANVLHMQLFK